MHFPKRIRAFFTLLLLVDIISLNAQDFYQTTSDSKLRSGPGTKYKSVFIIKKGEKVNVISKTNLSWFQIEYSGKKGYLSSKLLAQIIQTPKAEEIPQKETPTESNSSPFYILGLIGLVMVMILFASKVKKKQANTTEIVKQIIPEKRIDIVARKEMGSVNSNLNKLQLKMSSSEINKHDKNDTIIDVTGKEYTLNLKQPDLIKYAKGIPYWQHHYVYSYNEISGATSEQRTFYEYFKYRFLKGEYFDLEGNSNYAFILLFDLLNDYDNHKNLLQLETQLKELGQCYPKTNSYAISFLIQKMSKAGDKDGVARLRGEQSSTLSYGRSGTEYSFSGNYWGLGTKYKSKLNLSDGEVKLLNRLFYSNNNFSSIENCYIEILKLFLLTIENLKAKYNEAGTTIDQQFSDVVDVIARKQLGYEPGNFNYKYSIDTITNELYSNIFKLCENALREHYDHKRKLNTDTIYNSTDVRSEIETKIISKVTNIIPTLISTIKPPDEATDIELYMQNTNRWKIKFEELTSSYNNNSHLFIDNVLILGRLNDKNPSVENIFFEASKFVSKSDPSASLKLYIYYLYYDLKSVTFDNKQLTKTLQKSLFKTNEQLHDFEVIVSQLINDKNLENALQKVSNLYEVKRRKIKLDNASIQEVQQEDAGTVQMLNEYLKDEYEDETNKIHTQEINSQELKMAITQKIETIQQSPYLSDIGFSQLQAEMLIFFSKNNFSLPDSELDEFARSKGVFKDQLIDSVNEICYERLDDVLIEEDEEYYLVNQNYYKKLLSK